MAQWTTERRSKRAHLSYGKVVFVGFVRFVYVFAGLGSLAIPVCLDWVWLQGKRATTRVSRAVARMIHGPTMQGAIATKTD